MCAWKTFRTIPVIRSGWGSLRWAPFVPSRATTKKEKEKGWRGSAGPGIT